MDAGRFDQIARGLFAPVYPIIAAQIKERTGIVEGVCLDLGAGGGYLSMALAKITDLAIILLDRSDTMIDIAESNIAENSLKTRLRAIRADVHQIPLKVCSVDLVISRGSFFFWKDHDRAFAEVWRILAPGGKAYIGGGLGTPQLAEEIQRTMQASGLPGPGTGCDRSLSKDPRFYEDLLATVGVPQFSVTRGDEGFWIRFTKPGCLDRFAKIIPVSCINS